MIAATQKSFSILRAISERNGATLDTITAELGFSRSTCHAHLTTLQDVGVVTKEGAVYHIGLGILDFGGRAQARYRSYLVGREEIDKLAAEYETHVQVAFVEDDLCVYVYQSGQQYTRLPEPRLGTRIDFHSSAAGKVILASLPEQRRRELIEVRPLRAYTPNTKTDPAGIYDEINDVAESQLAFDFEEQFENIWCVSTPVAFAEDLIGAMSVSLQAESVDRSYLENTLADEVHKYGRLIELNRQYADWV